MSDVRSIVAVCACPPHFNPGMHLTDLSLQFTLRRLGIDTPPDRRVLYLPEELQAVGRADVAKMTRRGGRLDYRSFRDRLAELAAAPAVLYWGDFLHSRHYRGAVAGLLEQMGVADGREAARNVIDRHLFLAGEPDELLGRTLAFGGCMLEDDGSGTVDHSYVAAQHGFFRRVRGAWMRDVFSAARVSAIRGDAEDHLGVDPALLLQPADYEALAAPVRAPAGADRVAVFFARTQVPASQRIGLARELVKQHGGEAFWLPWFQEGALPPETLRLEWPRLHLPEPEPPLGALVSWLRGCRFVITDTYHLCLTAWNLGVPAVCITRGAERFSTAISDKKKELFAATYGAEDFLAFAEALSAGAGGIAEMAARLVRALAEPGRVALVGGQIRRHRERAERALHGRLREILRD